LARAATNSFAGTRPVDTPAFIVAQLIAALLAMLVARWFYRTPDRSDPN
jgi:glycerol uptake facilitator-like aquaporin